jgi:hypothetical protein
MVSCRHARLSSTGRWVSTDGEVAGVGLEFLVLARDGRSRLPGILTGGRERRGAASHVRHGRHLTPMMERSGRWPPRFVVASHGLSTGLLPISAAPVRAPCERTAVERCRIAFDEYTDFGSTMPLLSVGVRRRVLSGWVCKPEVTGLIPVRSTEKPAGNGGFLSLAGLQDVQNDRLWKRDWKREVTYSTKNRYAARPSLADWGLGPDLLAVGEPPRGTCRAVDDRLQPAPLVDGQIRAPAALAGQLPLICAERRRLTHARPETKPSERSNSAE